ncbi:phage major capsid family protein [Mycolicibacterium fallax]|uniref:Phage capsid-like C-terminal domain-containing protein n=1 Tax=Mycolicibacterium fallax TaxID=1793 RepID=A0A1X1RFH1_MYCFA|nr:phage major capsid protein [Mycolicibacterium fallax]ORV04599.1 hypothetical protein AWC04_08375 [Mycolicibacterium fallax]BBY99657.1 hypothetical protein MFAL_31240 [Mycolicibacterium fallax]
MTAEAHSSQTTAKPFHPDSTLIEADQVVADALYLTSAQNRGELTNDEASLRIGLVNDDDASTVRELETIPLSEAGTAEVTVQTTTVAAYQEVSRAQYETEGFGGVLAASIARSITRRADRVLLTDVDASTGILAAAGATEATVGDDLFALSDLAADLETLGADPDHWLMAPRTWAALQRVVRASGSNESLLGLGTSDTQRLLLGREVRTNKAVPEGVGLLVDPKVVAAVYSPLRADVSYDAGFQKIAVAVRSDWRVGHVLTRPERLGRFYVDGVTGSSILDLGGATDGTYSLTFRGRTTAAIAHNANAGAVKTALVALDDGLLADAWTVTSADGKFTIGHPAGVLSGSGELLVGGTGLVVS